MKQERMQPLATCVAMPLSAFDTSAWTAVTMMSALRAIRKATAYMLKVGVDLVFLIKSM
jgi:hypothetical protein